MGFRALRLVMGALLVAGTAVWGCTTESSPGPSPTSEAPVDEPMPGGGSGSAQGTSSGGAPAGDGGGGADAANPAGTTVLSSGTFVAKDHAGSGKVMVMRGADGALFLRIESLTVDNGPALHVLLTKEASPSSGAEVERGLLDLGLLRSTSGNLTYPIAAGTDPSAYAGVIIYCVDFKVVFIAAPLSA